MYWEMFVKLRIYVFLLVIRYFWGREVKGFFEIKKRSIFFEDVFVYLLIFVGLIVVFSG